MPVYYFIETGPRETDISHEAAQIRTPSGGGFGLSTYAVSLCGVAFEEHDSWVMGFGSDPKGRVNCPHCLRIASTTKPLVIEESSLIEFHLEARA